MLSSFVRFARWPKRPGARHVLVGCGIAIGLVLAIITAMLVVLVRHADMLRAERDLRNIAFLLSEETERGFAGIDLAETDLITSMRLRGIDAAAQFDRLMATEAVQEDLHRRIAGLRHVSAMVLIDRDGKLINTSRYWPPPDIDVSDRSFFRAFATDPHATSYLSAPIQSRTDGVWVTLFAHAFRSPTGELLGIVSVGMEPTSFEEMFSQVSIGAGASVALWRNDGVLLARYPHQDVVAVGTNYGQAAEFQRVMAARDRDLVRHASMIDGADRLIAPQSVPHFPLMLAVTETVGAIAAQSRPVAFWMISGTTLTELVLAAIVVLGVRRLRDQEQLDAAQAAALEAEATALQAEAARAIAEAELERARERTERDKVARVESMRFDTALANMLQGLAMFDGNRHLLVANPRLSALLGVPEGVLCPGMDFDAFVQAILDHGHVAREDVLAVVRHRTDMIGQRQRDSMVWELSDGRALSITHQPMEDGWLATYEDISDRRRAEERLAYMARHDLLTDLPNRAFFHERLELALAFARRGRLVALLCLDLDQFKAVNDTLGHPVGDRLLQAVARRLAEQIRDVDIIARLGGDEFAIIQTTIDKPSDAAGLAARLIEIMEVPFAIGEHQIAINTSIGIAFAPQDGFDADILLKNADLALYRAKVDGRRTYRLFQAQMDIEIQARRTMEIELRAALELGQFELFYQPLIGVATRSVTGFEALLRWRHPIRGMIPPGAFIGLAEETGLIVPMGEWVLRQACVTAAGWPDHIRLAVNLSPVQFRDGSIVPTVAAALRDAGLAAKRLELEITETAMMADTEATVASLHEFRALGVDIAMDDFGTGYSSLSYLRRFPFDRIKIDQSFVLELGRQSDCAAIVRAVTGLSRELGIAVTAEGVETNEQLRVLVMAGCTDLQGYLFSPPVAEQEVPGLLGTLGSVGELMPPVGLVA